MWPATSETVNVTAATPIIDIKTETTTTNVTLEELQNIPSARDPWVVMQTVPTDRTSTASTSADQNRASSPVTTRKGAPDAREHLEHRRRADHRHGRHRLDRRPTTTSTCSRRWQFHDRRRRTRRTRTAGRGAEHRAEKGLEHAARQREHAISRTQGLQATNMPADDFGAQTLGGARQAKGQSHRQISTITASSVGGPILKDRLWAWGSLGKTDVRKPRR